jgi:transposase-like protein
MKKVFTKAFKIQAVEKALNRSDSTTLKEVALSLGIGCSTLDKWIVKARNQEFEVASPDEINRMTKDKRPQDWTLEERLNMVVACSSLDEEALNRYCREHGVYPHHVKQWKLDFVNGSAQSTQAASGAEIKTLKAENKALKKELNRKDKALAETAALLVLQKKVNEIWGKDEDSSQ